MALRYQRQTLYSDHSGVKTFDGLDPLTGLPVLIYEFSGKPDPALSDLESENIPGVLDTLQENGKGQVVVAYSKGYAPAAKPLKLPALKFVMGSAQALNDAARAGVVHGDLRPERFLLIGSHVLVEGFGIPWSSTPSPYSPPEGVANYAGDVYAFGKTMQELCPDLPVPIKTLLDRCLARKPEDRPSAAQLLTALIALQKPPYGQLQSTQTPPAQATSAQATSAQAAPAQSAPQVSPVQSAFSFSQPQASPNTPPAPQQKTLEIDFNVSEEETLPPAPVIPPVASPSAKAKTPTLPDMPELDLFPEEPQQAANAPKPTLKQSSSFDNWDDDPADGMLLETDPGNTKASVTSKTSLPVNNPSHLPPKTSGKLPESGPKRETKNIDPKQTFIKDLPPGGTYKVGKATDIKAAPFKETPMAPSFDEVFLKGNKSSKNTLRIVMVVSLLLGALILAGLVFFRRDGVRGPATETTTVASYIVGVNVDPSSLPPLDLLVISSPEGSKFRAGAVVSKVPGQIVLDRAGTWQFQARFQDVLSQPVTLQLPEQRSLTIAMPGLVPPTEGEETPEDGEATENPATTNEQQ